MKLDRESGLFAGLPAVVESALGVSKFYSKSASRELTRRPLRPESATLVRELFALLDRNWALALNGSHSFTEQNFRWWCPQPNLTEGNPSVEVSLERQLIRALIKEGRTDWSNQVPLMSGIAGPHAFKKRAVDLVRRIDNEHFEFVELKIASDTPVYAAVEILVYGLLWVLSRRDRLRLGYADNPILAAQSLGLSVLAPPKYYSDYPLGDLAKVIDEGVRATGRRHGVDMSFRFTKFPPHFRWPTNANHDTRLAGPDLIALLDGRESL